MNKNIARDEPEEEKNILELLHTLLRQQYSQQPSSRTIIFVSTRQIAQYLADHLNTVKIVNDSSRFAGYLTSIEFRASLKKSIVTHCHFFETVWRREFSGNFNALEGCMCTYPEYQYKYPEYFFGRKVL